MPAGGAEGVINTDSRVCGFYPMEGQA